MNRDLLDISDGHLYRENHMAPLACNECRGCSDCCINMDQSIILDPLDIYLLTSNLGLTFEELMQKAMIELHVEEGLLLPNLKMVPKSLNMNRPPECYFLNEERRCSIHEFRPGICRLFPLGRNFEGDDLSYFVLKDACSVKKRDKVKIADWLGYDDPLQYREFVEMWHGLRRQIRQLVLDADDEKYASAITTGFIKLFYMTPYQGNFYEEFKARIASL